MIVADPVECRCQVRVEYPPAGRADALDWLADGLNRIVAAAAGPEACHSRHEAEEAEAWLAAWLAPRDLAFHEDKTRIVILGDAIVMRADGIPDEGALRLLHAHCCRYYTRTSKSPALLPVSEPTGLLEPDAWKRARPVLRRPGAAMRPAYRPLRVFSRGRAYAFYGRGGSC